MIRRALVLLALLFLVAACEEPSLVLPSGVSTSIDTGTTRGRRVRWNRSRRSRRHPPRAPRLPSSTRCSTSPGESPGSPARSSRESWRLQVGTLSEDLHQVALETPGAVAPRIDAISVALAKDKAAMLAGTAPPGNGSLATSRCARITGISAENTALSGTPVALRSSLAHRPPAAARTTVVPRVEGSQRSDAFGGQAMAIFDEITGFLGGGPVAFADGRARRHSLASVPPRRRLDPGRAAPKRQGDRRQPMAPRTTARGVRTRIGWEIGTACGRRLAISRWSPTDDRVVELPARVDEAACGACRAAPRVAVGGVTRAS